MMTVITGGSGSGKSAYAEDYIGQIAAKSDHCNKYYIATMKVYDAEGQKKIDRHRQLRQGKGFNKKMGYKALDAPNTGVIFRL